MDDSPLAQGPVPSRDDLFVADAEPDTGGAVRSGVSGVGAPMEPFVPVVGVASGDLEPARGPRRARWRVVAGMVVVAVAATAGFAAWGVTSNDALTSARGSLASTQTDLASTTASVDAASADLATVRGTLATTTTARAERASQAAALEAQVTTEIECLDRQQAALDELRRITDLSIDNFNRTAEKSTWDVARMARGKALNDASEAYYQGYKLSFEGNATAARAAAARGRADVATVTAQEKIMRDQQAIIDSASVDIETAIDALADKLNETDAACAAVPK